MPGFDNTGPAGNGPNGRGMGPCGGGQASWGRGGAFGRGRRGNWRRFQMAPSFDDEKESLEQQKNQLETQLLLIAQKLQKLG